MAVTALRGEELDLEVGTAPGGSAFMSGNQQSPDMICEVFVLRPSDLVGDRDLPTQSTTSAGR